MRLVLGERLIQKFYGDRQSKEGYTLPRQSCEFLDGLTPFDGT
jgi:hypothetical protein